MIEILDSKPSISLHHPLCATSQIRYYDHLRKDCQPKYEELYSLKSFDIRQKKLLEYLKESLTKMPQEEGEYNRQVALLTCQTILKARSKNQI